MKSNKGFTVVEMVVAFALVSIVLISLMRITMNYKDRMQIDNIRIELTNYKNNLTRIIQNDVINKGLKEVKFCDQNSVDCLYFDFLDGYRKELRLSFLNYSDNNSVRNKSIKYGDILYKINENIPENLPSGKIAADFQSIFRDNYFTLEKQGGKWLSPGVCPDDIYKVDLNIKYFDMDEDFGLHMVLKTNIKSCIPN